MALKAKAQVLKTKMLPAGWYQQVLQPTAVLYGQQYDQREVFFGWADSLADGYLTITKSEPLESGEVYVVFRVEKPVPWADARLGFPDDSAPDATFETLYGGKPDAASVALDKGDVAGAAAAAAKAGAADAAKAAGEAVYATPMWLKVAVGIGGIALLGYGVRSFR